MTITIIIISFAYIAALTGPFHMIIVEDNCFLSDAHVLSSFLFQRPDLQSKPPEADRPTDQSTLQFPAMHDMMQIDGMEKK